MEYCHGHGLLSFKEGAQRSGFRIGGNRRTGEHQAGSKKRRRVGSGRGQAAIIDS